MPMLRSFLTVAAIACFLTGDRLSVGKAHGADWAALTRYLPPDANAIVLVDAAKLWDSPIGRQQKWREQAAQRQPSAPLSLPAMTEQCLLATELDVATLRPDWEAAVIAAAADTSMADIIKRRGGTPDTLSTLEAAWITSKTCVVKLAPKLFGLLTGGNRQDAVRWVAGITAAKRGSLSPYLTTAVQGAATNGAAVTLAVDLAGAFRPEDVRAAIAGSPILAGASEGDAAAILATVAGVRLTVQAGENLQGRLQLDAAVDTSALAPVAKQLMLGMLAKSGAMLDEYESWNGAAEANSLVLQGPLSIEGLRRLLSLVTIDPSELQQDAATTPSPPPATTADAEKQRVAGVTRRYFAGVSRYINDLSRLNRARSIDQAAMWLENYARGINSLSTRGVDPEVVEYGNYVAQTLQSIVDQAYGVADMAAQVNGPPQPTGYRVGLLPTGRTVNYGGNFMRMYAPYGYMDFQSPQADQEQRQRTTDQIYEATKQARATLDQLIADHETVRSKLQQRYGAGF